MPNTKNILSVLADNPALVDAVKAVLVKQFELPKEIDPRADDALLGQRLRAHTTVTSGVEAAFKEIMQYKTLPDSPERKNPAR